MANCYRGSEYAVTLLVAARGSQQRRMCRLATLGFILARFGQKCKSKCIRRQGIVLRHRNSLQTNLCPVVICPYLTYAALTNTTLQAKRCAAAGAGTAAEPGADGADEGEEDPSCTSILSVSWALAFWRPSTSIRSARCAHDGDATHVYPTK